jgi:hypothetical protein
MKRLDRLFKRIFLTHQLRTARLVICTVLAFVALSGGVLPLSEARAGQDIYTFQNQPVIDQNTRTPAPIVISTQIQQDLDTLDIGVTFRDDLAPDSFAAPIPQGNDKEVPQLRISILPNVSGSSLFGVYGGSFNAATLPNYYSQGIPQPAKSWIGNGLFPSPLNGITAGNCPVTAIWPNRRQMIFTFSRTCVQLPSQFSVSAEIAFVSATNQTDNSYTRNLYSLNVDLSVVPGFKLDQRISAQSVQSTYLTQGSIQIAANSSSQLPLSYSILGTQNICSIANPAQPVVNLLNPGTCTVSVSAAGNEKYQPAVPVQVSFQILAPQQDQNISQNLPFRISLDSPQISFSASSSSGAPVTASSSNPNICLVSGNQSIIARNPGNCQIILSAPTSGVYRATQSIVNIQVLPKKQEQKVYYNAPGEVRVGDSGFDIDLTNSANLQMVVTSSTPEICDFSQGNDPLFVTIISAGTCTFEVSQDGNDQYLPFSASGVTFEILPALPVGTKRTSVPKSQTSTPSAPVQIKIKSSTSTTGNSGRLPTQTGNTSVVTIKSTITNASPSAKPNAAVKVTSKVSPSKSSSKPSPKPSPKK